jgi:site-specific recombinase XerD
MQEIRRFKPSTVSRRFPVTAGFYRTCAQDGIPEHSPAEHVRRPTVPAESPTLGFTHLQFEALLTAARQSPNRYDFALVAMLGLLGLRIFESTATDIADLGEEHGHRVLPVCGKDTKAVLVPLPPAGGRAIDRAVGARIRGPVLLNSRGARMDRHAATRRLRQLAEIAGSQLTKAHPHMLRHPFATTSFDAGVDLRDVQIAARHADPRTTMRYDRAARTWTATPITSSPPTWPPAPDPARVSRTQTRETSCIADERAMSSCMLCAGLNPGVFGATPHCYHLLMDQPQVPCRIGVVLMARRGLNDAAFRFLVLAMNSEQGLVQFEFYNPDPSDPLLVVLQDKQEMAGASVRRNLPSFADRLRDCLVNRIAQYGLAEEPPDHFVIISHSRFDDNFYSARQGKAAVIALGNWKRYMAPPSLLEFVQMLLVREAVAVLCPSLRGSVHLGNKGCLLDFTEILSEVRQKALRGYVGSFCRECMSNDGQAELAEIVTYLLGRQWLGSPVDPCSPAGIAANLGYNLFIVKGLRATPREVLLATLQQESVKQLIVVVGSVLITLIIVLIGLKS